MVRILVIGNIGTYVIAVSVNFTEVVGTLDITAESPCRLNGQKRVVANDIHVERKAGVCDQCARCAETEYADGLAHELGTCEIGLALFDKLGYLIALTGYALDPLNAAENISRRHDERAYRLLLDRFGICAGAVEHDYALFGKLLDWDVVIARSGSCDAEKRSVGIVPVHIGTAHDDALGIIDIRRDIVAELLELIQSHRRNIVYCLYIIHCVQPQIVS